MDNQILKKTTAMNLWLRIMIGVFLLYQAYSLGIELKTATGNDLIIFGVSVVIFAISGVVLTAWSLYRLIKKDYYDPLSEADDENEDSKED